MKPERPTGPAPTAMLIYAEKDNTLCRLTIVNKSLTKPGQFERLAANARLAWLLISQVSGRDGRDDTTGVHDESPSCSDLGRWHTRVF